MSIQEAQKKYTKYKIKNNEMGCILCKTNNKSGWIIMEISNLG